MGCTSASSAGDAQGPPAQFAQGQGMCWGGQAGAGGTGSEPEHRQLPRPHSRLVQRAATCPANMGGTHGSPAQRSPHGGCGDAPAAEGLMRQPDLPLQQNKSLLAFFFLISSKITD